MAEKPTDWKDLASVLDDLIRQLRNRNGLNSPQEISCFAELIKARCEVENVIIKGK
jgi:hypothetical protein